MPKAARLAKMVRLVLGTAAIAAAQPIAARQVDHATGEIPSATAERQALIAYTHSDRPIDDAAHGNLCVAVSLENPPGFRDPNVMLVSVTNGTQAAQTVDCLYSCYSHLNGGFPLEQYFLGHVDGPVVIQPGQTHVFQRAFTPTISLEATQLSPFLSLYAEVRAYDEQGGVTILKRARESFYAFAKGLELLNPPQNPLLPGLDHTLSYRVSNHLDVPMQGVQLSISGYSQNMTINGERSVLIPLQPLMPAETIDVTVTLSSPDPDAAGVVAMLTSDTVAVPSVTTAVNFGVCPADINRDGLVTPEDFSAWVAAFKAMDPSADVNGDGEVTPADFSAWIKNYNAGC